MTVFRLLRQDMAQVDFGLRRFRLRPGPARQTLESAGRAFLTGLNAALCADSLSELAHDVTEVDSDLEGFAWEGAGMGAAIRDLLTPRARVAALLAGPAAAYPHLVHVGVGWAYARLRRRPGGRLPLDPLLRWLAWDGYGFHRGFFAADRVIGGQRLEPGLSQAQRAVRDQGLGRALWFHECADPDAVALRVAEFASARRADLWSGVGLAATYAGGATDDELARLVVLAGRYHADLAQGSAFAAKARLVSTIVPAHVESAVRILTGATVACAAEWTDKALPPGGSTLGDYQRWRADIRHLWGRTVVAV